MRCLPGTESGLDHIEPHVDGPVAWTRITVIVLALLQNSSRTTKATQLLGARTQDVNDIPTQLLERQLAQGVGYEAERTQDTRLKRKAHAPSMNIINVPSESSRAPQRQISCQDGITGDKAAA